MQHQDWKNVTWHKNTKKSKESRRRHNPPGSSRFRELDGDNPPPPPAISHDIKLAIQRARMAKKLSQKDLANRLNLPLKTIKDYESGKAIPDNRVLGRIKRFLRI